MVRLIVQHDRSFIKSARTLFCSLFRSGFLRQNPQHPLNRRLSSLNILMDPMFSICCSPLARSF